MHIFKKIDLFCIKHSLLQEGSTIIIGLSGGPDSVFLLYYLLHAQKNYQLKLIAAHLNHQWRDTAEHDAYVCRSLCEKLGIPFIYKTISELGLSYKPTGSKEQDARIARRAFFSQAAHEHGATAIALAHHLDDQEETFFIRLFRGADVAGLACMRPKKGIYVRPLLTIRKDQIMAWLAKEHISFAIDPTNESSAFLRNRIRLKLIPLAAAIDERFHSSFAATLNRLQETDDFLNRMTEHTFNEIATFNEKNGAHALQKELFLRQHPVMRYRLIVYWLAQEKAQLPISQAFFDELLRFLNNDKSISHAVGPHYLIIKKKGIFYLQKSQ